MNTIDLKLELLLVFLTLLAITITTAMFADSRLFVALGLTDQLQYGFIVLATVKIYLITEYFMELRYAPTWLRALMNFWIVSLMMILLSIMISR